ncbi:DUF429 domain-containing protein [Vibrio lentus]|nr:DUF429 domain-containing protein [Vibrio lentus]
MALPSPAPGREAVYQTNYIAGCNANVGSSFDKKFSKQTWGIVPKIRELDELIESHPSLSIRESHPEVVFAALKDEPPSSFKTNTRSKRGTAFYYSATRPQWCDRLSLAISNTKRKDVAIDDIHGCFCSSMLIAYYAPGLP